MHTHAKRRQSPIHRRTGYLTTMMLKPISTLLIALLPMAPGAAIQPVPEMGKTSTGQT